VAEQGESRSLAGSLSDQKQVERRWLQAMSPDRDEDTGKRKGTTTAVVKIRRKNGTEQSERRKQAQHRKNRQHQKKEGYKKPTKVKKKKDHTNEVKYRSSNKRRKLSNFIH